MNNLWSNYEKLMFKNYYLKFDRNFKSYSELLKTKSLNQIKYFFHSVLRLNDNFTQRHSGQVESE
ncbi:Homeobox-like_domain superfamily [Hexamita inflata]|uniref:Homeobox-like domain superfamily n=1 Tax=Hexamita inflata TaxID=28002 RepID=A0AA86PE49_9EUKA|nr:Homeobox-like domain superfamily [Hexamita inflata]